MPRALGIDFVAAAHYTQRAKGVLDHSPEVGRPVDLVDLEVDPLGHAVVAAEVFLDLPEQGGLAELPSAVDEAGAGLVHDRLALTLAAVEELLRHETGGGGVRLSGAVGQRAAKQGGQPIGRTGGEEEQQGLIDDEEQTVFTGCALADLVPSGVQTPEVQHDRGVAALHPDGSEDGVYRGGIPVEEHPIASVRLGSELS